MIRYALIGACLMAMPAMADDAPLEMKAETVIVRDLSVLPPMMASISPDGLVRIDWPAVEATAADDRAYMSAIAKVLLAVRDGTWVAMDGGKP